MMPPPISTSREWAVYHAVYHAEAARLGLGLALDAPSTPATQAEAMIHATLAQAWATVALIPQIVHVEVTP